MKSKALLFLMLLAASSMAFAVDNQITIQANAEVTRSCMLDFAPANASQQSVLVFNALDITLAAREVDAGPEVATATVYETCNEDYKIIMRSLNGGLKHASNGYVHAYSATYPRSNDSVLLSMQSSELFGGVAINKTVDDWRTNHPGNEGKSPYFEPRSFVISIPKSPNLQSGFYSDTISLEITEKDASGTEVIYNAGGSAPVEPGPQVILTGGG